MDEEETKACPNCKREIPAVNFTIHSVHCARNIRICPVCKEPVPGSELDDHHKKMHKLLPCKQCGESVCGTDLEDHIRDSCANTVKSCRFCELELPRRELPAHEVYCGVRTEQCPDCKEYVMIKYQQLHLDSNHGFIRLDDDPAPPKKEPPRLNLARPLPKSNLNRPNTSSNAPKIDNIAQRPTSIFDDFQRPDNRPTSSVANSPKPSNVKNRPSPNTGWNPRPNKPLSNSEAPDFGPSSSNPRPDSSNNGLVSSKPDVPMNSLVNPRPGSFNDRLGLMFATPPPVPTSSNSALASPDSRPSSSNTRQGSSNSAQNPSNSPQNSFSTNFGQDPYTRHGPSNAGHDSSNFRQNLSSGQEPCNPRQGSFNSAQNMPNPVQNSNPRQNSANCIKNSSNKQGSSNLTHTPNIRQTSSNPIQNSNPRQDTANSKNLNTRQDSDRPNSSNPRPSNFDIAGRAIVTNIKRNTNEVNQGSINNGDRPSTSNISPEETSPNVARAGVKKRTNDQPQINMDTAATKTVDKDLGAVSRGAVKKRPAPQPPRSSRRDLPYYSAVQRQQREDRDRQLQNEYNLAHGLPPVLNPAQKIEKLRKLDALQNRDFEEEYRGRQRRPSPEPHYQHYDGQRLGGRQDDATRMDFKNLKPMSPTQFMRRFSSLQVSPSGGPSGVPSGGPPARPDRFPDIKSSLRELRRGLNEVTAPYNANNNAAPNNNNEGVGAVSPSLDEVRLPCEFCNALLPPDDLVQHQTGCRPDLAQLVAPSSPSSPRARGPPSPQSPPHADPVIPCEFCMRSLPVYLITEHQERCIQENMPV